MAKAIYLTRDEAEYLTEVLMPRQEAMARSLSAELRELFGMVSEDDERASGAAMRRDEVMRGLIRAKMPTLQEAARQVLQKRKGCA